MTPEQQRIVALEQTIAKMQKAIAKLDDNQKKTSKAVDALHQGALRLERACKKVEVLAKRGISNAATNASLIANIQRRFKK